LTIPYTPAFCAPGNRTGTPDYLAPELVKRLPTDHRVDLYALGVTAFEVFTARLPWERTPSSEENFRRRLNTPHRDPKDLNPKLDDDVCELLTKSIAKEPQDRFATARQFKEALLRLDRQDY
ncbi:MAG TPA: protein kinase, partial [Gemmataceae bacterium]|nr:protein kinase [Gemmataceae bacterium]